MFFVVVEYFTSNIFVCPTTISSIVILINTEYFLQNAIGLDLLDDVFTVYPLHIELIKFLDLLLKKQISRVILALTTLAHWYQSVYPSIPSGVSIHFD